LLYIVILVTYLNSWVIF